MLSDVYPASELHRLTYNALQYSGKDTTLKGVTSWWRGDGALSVTAYDDYFGIHDEIQSPCLWVDEEFQEMVMELSDLQLLERKLRDQTEPFELGAEWFRKATESEQWTINQVYDTIVGVKEGLRRLQIVNDFAVNPDRLRRLALLKPKGYPLDFRLMWDDLESRDVITFKYGPTLMGMIATLDRYKLLEIYKGDKVLWE